MYIRNTKRKGRTRGTDATDAPKNQTEKIETDMKSDGQSN